MLIEEGESSFYFPYAVFIVTEETRGIAVEEKQKHVEETIYHINTGASLNVFLSQTPYLTWYVCTLFETVFELYKHALLLAHTVTHVFHTTQS